MERTEKHRAHETNQLQIPVQGTIYKPSSSSKRRVSCRCSLKSPILGLRSLKAGCQCSMTNLPQPGCSMVHVGGGTHKAQGHLGGGDQESASY